ncbi:hypothetical protein IV203_008062 [Nitzschia inconspicua]|uniref:Uncharacterized protein n=1 Tax=Nitzschia inconspicua TaxID=303405 RepID=A0A9K3KYY9_9STRA|nr:hypothetical protein IV203_008062 [Nitzschia inconspicua]
MKNPQRILHRHHSQPLPRTKRRVSFCPSSVSSRWDSGASPSASDGINSDPQLIFPLRTCDDQRYSNPTNRTDRWSVSRYHSDSLVTPRRPEEKLPLVRLLKSKSTSTKPECAGHSPEKPSFSEAQPEMEMTWRRSKPFVRRRSSLRSLPKGRPLPTVQEMEIIWERENSMVEKPDDELAMEEKYQTSDTTTGDNSAPVTSPKPRTCPSMIFSLANTAMEELIDAVVLMMRDSLPPKVGDETTAIVSPRSNTSTILNFCGGDIAPACQQLEYDMMDYIVTSPLLRLGSQRVMKAEGLDSKTLSSLRRMSSCVTL